MTTWSDLTGCTGYRVETAEGRIGNVAAVLPRTERAKPGVLILQSGLVGCGLMVVSFEQIEAVDHERRRLLLREVPTSQEASPTGARDRLLTRA
jgi:hypothetical protein